MLSTGIRFGEAAALRSSDVDFEGGLLHIEHTLTRLGMGEWVLAEPKTARSRRVLPMPGFATNSLRRQRRASLELRLLAGMKWEDSDLVFTTNRGTPLRQARVLDRLKKVRQVAGLRPIRMHDLRHTFAT